MDDVSNEWDKIAPCGTDCSRCPAYRATRAGDARGLAFVAIRWRELYHLERFSIVDAICDGCLQRGGRRGGPCRVCEVHACAEARGISHCSECPEYGPPGATAPTCPALVRVIAAQGWAAAEQEEGDPPSRTGGPTA